MEWILVYLVFTRASQGGEGFTTGHIPSFQTEQMCEDFAERLRATDDNGGLAHTPRNQGTKTYLITQCIQKR